MSETEEALRLMVMLGQMLVPGAREVARLFARGVESTAAAAGRGTAKGAKAAVGKAKGAYEKAQNSKDGAGRLGWVKREALGDRNLMMAEMPEALRREDLSAFGQACGQLGVRFAVAEVAGESRLVFEAKSAEAMRSASAALLHGFHMGEAAGEAARKEAPQGQEGFSWGGLDFKQVSPGCYEAQKDGLTVRADQGGRWAVRDAAGVVLTPDGLAMEGKVASPKGAAALDAAAMGCAYAKTVSNKGLMEADAKAGYRTPARLAKVMSAARVRASVEGAAERRDHARAQAQSQRHAHTKKRAL